MKSLHASAAGRRTVLYPLVPRDRRHYTPSMIGRISETDSLRAHTSKKSSDVRAAEICSAASPEFLSWVMRDGAEVSRETGGSLVITEIMLETHGGKSQPFVYCQLGDCSLLLRQRGRNGSTVDSTRGFISVGRSYAPHRFTSHIAVIQGPSSRRSLFTCYKRSFSTPELQSIRFCHCFPTSRQTRGHCFHGPWWRYLRDRCAGGACRRRRNARRTQPVKTKSLRSQRRRRRINKRMGCSDGRDPLIRVRGGGCYIDMYSDTRPQINRPFWAALAPFQSPTLASLSINMPGLLRRARRSSTGHHPLQPAADPRGTGITSFVSISTLFAWTFGSGTVVCSRHRSSPFPNTVWGNSFGGYGQLCYCTPSSPQVWIVAAFPG